MLLNSTLPEKITVRLKISVIGSSQVKRTKSFRLNFSRKAKLIIFHTGWLFNGHFLGGWQLKKKNTESFIKWLPRIKPGFFKCLLFKPEWNFLDYFKRFWQKSWNEKNVRIQIYDFDFFVVGSQWDRDSEFGVSKVGEKSRNCSNFLQTRQNSRNAFFHTWAQHKRC